ncbi:MAG: hypothetical protein KA801_12930 [Syntrophorhabdaceae bacterium]|nr:hypothetical protein [Syntrophorhabdaceae bacterium]
MMTSIAEFIKVRESIEELAKQITLLVERKTVKDARGHLDNANRQFEILKTMVANDTQKIVESRLSAQLAGLGVKVGKMEAKVPARKRAATKKPEVTPVKPEISDAPQIVVFERP